MNKPFSGLTFVTLTTDGFWKKALEKGRSVAFSGKHVPIRQLIHSHGPGTVELAKDHESYQISCLLFLSYQFLLFLNVTH